MRTLFFICLIELEVETAALDGVGTDFAVGYGHVVGVDCIALEGLFALQCAVEHHVGIRRGQAAVDVYLDVEESGHLAYESFQTCLDLGLYLLLLFFGEFWIQCPENDVLNHN